MTIFLRAWGLFLSMPLASPAQLRVSQNTCYFAKPLASTGVLIDTAVAAENILLFLACTRRSSDGMF